MSDYILSHLSFSLDSRTPESGMSCSLHMWVSQTYNVFTTQC